MSIGSWAGRGSIVVASLLGVRLAAQTESSAEIPRFVPFSVSRVVPADMGGFTSRAGSVDNLTDTADGLLLEGWLNTDVDSVVLIVDKGTSVATQKALLLPRPEVQASGATDGVYFSGFRVILPGIEVVNVRCIVFEGPSGSESMWPDEDG